jgi:transposase InsO family protein
LGFWVPWWPFSLGLCWPFCFHVAVVLDHFSRAVVASRAFGKQPSAAELCALLESAVAAARRVAPHIVSDQGTQFRDEYRARCAKIGTTPRFGKIGEHGSIAVIERFWRSMKTECFRRIVVPMNLTDFERELEAYVIWYNELRPHSGLFGKAPVEVRDGLVPASERPALEPRVRYRLAPRAGPGRLRRRLRGRLVLSVTHFRGRKHLPVVELRRAA